jgi:hypothetical protein
MFNIVLFDGYPSSYLIHTTGMAPLKNNITLCTPYRILFGWSSQKEWDGWDMWHVWGTGEEHTGFWWEGPREGD